MLILSYCTVSLAIWKAFYKSKMFIIVVIIIIIY